MSKHRHESVETRAAIRVYHNACEAAKVTGTAQSPLTFVEWMHQAITAILKPIAPDDRSVNNCIDLLTKDAAFMAAVTAEVERAGLEKVTLKKDADELRVMLDELHPTLRSLAESSLGYGNHQTKLQRARKFLEDYAQANTLLKQIPNTTHE